MNTEPRRYTYFDALWQSFFSRSLYVDVWKRWSGLGFLYLLMIVIISWLPPLAKVQSAMEQLRSGKAEGIIRQIPAINIIDGVASTDVETPYFIKDPNSGKILAIIDMTGQYTDLNNTSAIALLTRHEVIVKRTAREARVYSISGVKHFTIDRARARRWLQLITSWFVVVFAPFAMVFTYVYRICQALIYALVGMAFAESFHVKLSYSTLLRLVCVAVTPVILLTAVVDILPSHPGIPRPFAWLVYLVMAVLYVRFAVKSCAEASVESTSITSPAPPLA